MFSKLYPAFTHYRIESIIQCVSEGVETEDNSSFESYEPKFVIVLQYGTLCT